jgi:hypothetical protein
MLSSYASLEEAYNIPASDFKKKKKNTEVTPNDLYVPQNGQLAAEFKPQKIQKQPPQPAQIHQIEGIPNEQIPYFINEYKKSSGQSEGFMSNTDERYSSCNMPSRYPSLRKSPECEEFRGYKAQNQCEPLQSKPYANIISDDTKIAYEDAMKVAHSHSTEPIQSNLDALQAYSEDDMELYFDIEQETKTKPKPKPKHETEKSFIPEQINENKTFDYNWIIDLLIFLFIGILVIYLCDVIARIAMFIGAKRQFAEQML